MPYNQHRQTDVKGIVKGCFNGLIDNDDKVFSIKHTQLEENRVQNPYPNVYQNGQRLTSGA